MANGGPDSEVSLRSDSGIGTDEFSEIAFETIKEITAKVPEKYKKNPIIIVMSLNVHIHSFT